MIPCAFVHSLPNPPRPDRPADLSITGLADSDLSPYTRNHPPTRFVTALRNYLRDEDSQDILLEVAILLTDDRPQVPYTFVYA